MASSQPYGDTPVGVIGNDDYGQAGILFRLMSPDQQQRLMDNISAAMAGVPSAIVQRQIAHFAKADPAYGVGVAQRMGLSFAGVDLPGEGKCNARQRN